MKYLLVEEPESCETCPLRYYDSLMLKCAPLRKNVLDVKCPLRPLPQKKDVSYQGWTDRYKTAGEYLKAEGYNECLEELEK